MTLNSVDIAIGSVVTVGLLGAALAWQALKAGTKRRKLAVVREAALGSYPTADIRQMLMEIERGR